MPDPLPSNQNSKHVEWLSRLLEHYDGQATDLRMQIDRGEKGNSWESEWARYRQEADALRVGIAALQSSGEIERLQAKIAREHQLHDALRAECRRWEEEARRRGYNGPIAESLAPETDATSEAYRRWPEPHNSTAGAARYGFIEGVRWAGGERFGGPATPTTGADQS